MKTATICGVAVLLLISVNAKSADTLMTFEEFLGSNGSPISTFYSGVSFESANSSQEWVAGDATTGLYNVSSWPSKTAWGGGWFWMYDNVFGWTEVVGDDGKIMFDNQDATFVQLGYGASGIFHLEAYDSSNNLLDSDNGPANLRYTNGNENGPGTLRVDWDGTNHIAYVLVHDTGNQWCVDNVLTDASGIALNPIPAPGALLLGVLGTGVVGWLRRRKAMV